MSSFSQEEKHRLRSVFFRHGVSETAWQLETCLREVLGSRYCLSAPDVAAMHDFRRDGPVTPGGFEAIVARIHAALSDRRLTDETEVGHTYAALGGCGTAKDGTIMVGRLRKMCHAHNLSDSAFDVLLRDMDVDGSGKLKYRDVHAHLLGGEGKEEALQEEIKQTIPEASISPWTMMGVESPKHSVNTTTVMAVHNLQSKLARISREHASAVSDRETRLRRFDEMLAKESRRDIVTYEFVGPLGGAPTPVRRRPDTPLFVRESRSPLVRRTRPQKYERPLGPARAKVPLVRREKPQPDPKGLWGALQGKVGGAPAPVQSVHRSLPSGNDGWEQLGEGATKFREHLQWRVENNRPFMANV